MVESMDKNICEDITEVHNKADLNTKETTRPDPGQIEHLIATPYQGEIKHEREPAR